MCRGFELGDGWFALIDALSDVLTRHAEREQRPAHAVKQVKEKLGTLRYYVAADAADRWAIALAGEMSARVCEVSGRSGRLVRHGRRLVTRAPDLAPGLKLVAVGRDDNGRMLVPLLGFAAADIIEWRADVLVGPLEVPPGWLDLVDGMLRQVAAAARDAAAGTTTASARVDRVLATPHGLRVDHAPADPRGDGIIALASALAPRLDPQTGAAGPVTDDGILTNGPP